jgi:hypothetical protein
MGRQGQVELRAQTVRTVSSAARVAEPQAKPDTRGRMEHLEVSVEMEAMAVTSFLLEKFLIKVT